MYKLFSLLAITAITSCGSPEKDQPAEPEFRPTAEIPESNATESKPEPVEISGCYEMTMIRDTAELHLEIEDTLVTGRLFYNWHEKDENRGTLKGILRNGFILADYTFKSESLSSVREVIFKVDGHSLVQAYGELIEKNGKVVFKDPQQLHYNTAYPFLKVECP